MKLIQSALFLFWMMFTAIGESKPVMLVLVIAGFIALFTAHIFWATLITAVALAGYIAAKNSPRLF